ncbi:MAG: PLP-dependent cysteine synthase family protein [Intrasporangium sp.]|uniref:PLP-dependent cysteine synthase family protein n=1 Tax=Intrasporangium sp. TaxID=1925024 RepID=UPI00264A4AEB|nr:PLP-dependent cysteine synthase family protein [Intrasporangium sp.]MDN5797495.1 PLP-dependent cysteine synthase family protein [Intrasporangium sp.]
MPTHDAAPTATSAVTPLVDVSTADPVDRDWVARAVRLIQADTNRSADTHLLTVPLPGCPQVDLYLKDESTHPTGSLKHRLARSLILFALCNGQLGPDTTVVEASSGSTAISEAYFARMLGLPFVAVMASSTSAEKIALIQREGGRCRLVDDPSTVYDEAARIARECGGLYVDQFSHAERATDWRGNNNIAESVFAQLELERYPVPEWVVVGAGTGGTSATIGRYVRYRAVSTRICVTDPEGSAFLPGWRGDASYETRPSRIEGIGRPRVEPSFIGTVVDRMLGVPDAASIAAMRCLRERTGLHAGASTGTALYGALRLACELHEAGRPGSIVSLVCDRGERYDTTYGSDAWLERQGIDIGPYAAVLASAWDAGVWLG